MRTVIVLILICLSTANCSILLLTPLPVVSHYQSQDIFGQYSYGYAGGPSAKHELHTADGVTRGGYSYVDANGVLQTFDYVSDPENGFRVVGTNIPKPVTGTKDDLVEGPPESPEVLEAKLKHFEAHEQAKAKLRKARSIYYTIPVVPAVHYQALDPFGQYSYGYNDGLSAKAETRSLNGVTNGAYSYVDEKGHLQNVQYTADSLGFRASGSGIPQETKQDLPTPPMDTPEVIKARAEHLAVFDKVKNRDV